MRAFCSFFSRLAALSKSRSIFCGKVRSLANAHTKQYRVTKIYVEKIHSCWDPWRWKATNFRDTRIDLKFTDDALSRRMPQSVTSCRRHSDSFKIRAPDAMHQSAGLPGMQPQWSTALARPPGRTRFQAQALQQTSSKTRELLL